MLSSEILLTHYDPKLPLIIAADTSSHGVDAVISHILPNGSEKAIAHASRTLTPAVKKEALAIIYVVKEFHKFVYGRRFTLLTDHMPLLSIFGSKEGVPIHSANRLQRWTIMLLGHDFEIKYRKTTDFG